MTKENKFACADCGASDIGVFVQYGSYFTMCLKCRSMGPATSWLAVSVRFKSTVRAYILDEQLHEIEFLGEGVASELTSRIGKAAEEGKLVRLKSPIEELIEKLALLATKFRDHQDDAETRVEIIDAYNTVLASLLATGWKDTCLDPDCELPDEYMLKAYLQIRNALPSLNPPAPLLRRLLRDHDAILLDVIENIGQQVIAKPVIVYSSRFMGLANYSTEHLSFVGAPGSWGNVALKQGERALVFLKCLSGGRLYQHSYHAHFTVTKIDGALHAVANWDLLQNGKLWEPRFLFDAAFYLDTEKKGQVAMPYALLERYLEDELKSI